jgi:hypothetical protein
MATTVQVGGLCGRKLCILTAGDIWSLPQTVTLSILSRGRDIHIEDRRVVCWLGSIRIIFTPDQYFWYVYWIDRLSEESGAFPSTTDDNTIIFGKCTISNYCIVYEGYTIYHYQQVIIDEFGVYIRAYDCRYHLTRLQLVMIIAMSMVFSPTAVNLLY